MYTGYHTKAIESQRLLVNALLECLETDELHSVPIKDICAKANLTRQTFYSLFSTKENALLFHLRYDCAFTLDKIGENKKFVTVEDIAKKFSSYYIENKNFLNILNKNNLHYFIYDHLFQSIYNCRLPISNSDACDREFLSAYLAGAFVGTIIKYVEKDLSEEEIFKMTTNLVEGKYLITMNGKKRKSTVS